MNKAADYRKTVFADSLMRMVEIRSVVPDAVYDLRYGTAENFTGQKLYKDGNQAFLRLAAAKALAAAQQELSAHRLRIKIWDAYRPWSVTKRMWDLIRDERYVANPTKGSNHNRGLAVDLTLVDSAGNELAMGTGFDNFTDTAHHAFKALLEAVLQNRKLLRTVMEKHGFKALETEWWHYAFPNDRSYAVLDLTARKLLHRN